jgi:TetR/AcrR family transcriptional repressor for divergent bdcA
MKKQTGTAASVDITEVAKPTRLPRRPFDRDLGVIKAKELFHQHGYDALGIADLTTALGINPPSLYAAFGSKAGLFDRCLDIYVREANLPAAKILVDDRPLDEAVKALMLEAAKLYGKSATQRGCLVAEAMRAADPKARAMASKHGDSAAAFIESHIAKSHPERARELADFVVTALRGLSAAAQVGLSRKRLMAVASLTGAAFQSLTKIKS